MSTEGNDPTAGKDAGTDPTPDPAPTESTAPPEPPPPAPDPTPEPEPDPAPPPPPPPAAESTAAAPQGSAPAAGFDFAAVQRSVWISAGGALILLISVFFSWYTATASVSLPGGNSLSRSASGSGWSSGDGAKLVFLLALVILAVWAVDLFADNVTLPFPAAMVALVLGAVALLVCVIKFFSKPGGPDLTSLGGTLHFSVSVAWGLYVAILAAIAVVVGAYMHMNETSS
ncbi:MAG TPA: hypothetical protein VLK79_03130 [Gaiellales bacterium]|nr:hypothetical protein [Gaiellales bacterium]